VKYIIQEEKVMHFYPENPMMEAMIVYHKDLKAKLAVNS
jgi:hypothetical protein